LQVFIWMERHMYYIFPDFRHVPRSLVSEDNGRVCVCLCVSVGMHMGASARSPSLSRALSAPHRPTIDQDFDSIDTFRICQRLYQGIDERDGDGEDEERRTKPRAHVFPPSASGTAFVTGLPRSIRHIVSKQ
jgi:hypothetical protein